MMSDLLDPNQFIIESHSSLRDAMSMINDNLSKIVFICSNNSLIGSLSDGDIRRHLLRNGDLSDNVKVAMNNKPISIKLSDTNNSDVISKVLLSAPKINLFPVLDNDLKICKIFMRNKLPYFPIYEPSLDGKELSYLSNCLDTNWISSQGKYVSLFENSITTLLENKYQSLAVSSGTSALFLALKSLDIGEGDLVAVPSLTFAATVNAIIHTGASPIFIDVDKHTWCITPETIKPALSYGIKALISVDLYGNSCDSEAIKLIAKKHNFWFIEDAAEALGTKYNKKHVGAYADAVTFSFFGNKTVTTGEGGMVCFKENLFFEKAKVLRDHGMNPTKRYWHDTIGYNFRLTNLQASIGVAQMERLENIIGKKIEIHNLYFDALNHLLEFQKETKNCSSSFWLTSAIISNKQSIDDIIKTAKDINIEIRRGFYPIHSMPPYASFPKCNLANTCSISSKIISLPSSPNLNRMDINYINDQLINYVFKDF